MPSTLPRNTSQLFNCNATDSRNVTWTGGTYIEEVFISDAISSNLGPSENVTLPCPDDADVNQGNSLALLQVVVSSQIPQLLGDVVTNME